MKLEIHDIWFGLLLIILMLFAGCNAGCEAGKRLERHRAIEAGVARFEVDEKTGETNFVYGIKQ